MDLGTALIGILFITVCAMPFVLSSRSRKKRNKQSLGSLKEFAKQHNCEITQHEICGNYAIGIDETKNHLFFQLNTKVEIKQHVVNLSTINNCNVVRVNARNKTIERLNLELITTDKNKPKTVLEFYNVDLSYQPIGELESIVKWDELVKKQLAKNKS